MSVDSLQLRYFVAVATLGSINKAAHHLNIAQSALSRRMAQLEHDLKASLFFRSTSGIELTEAGKRLLAKGISLAGQLEELGSVVQSRLMSYPPDTVQVGMTASAADLTLGQLVLRCSKEMPEAMLRVSEASGKIVRDELVKGSIEIAIDHNLRPDSRIASRTLWSERLLLVGPGGASRKELEEMPFLYAARDPDVQRILRTQFSKLRLKPRSVAHVTPASNVKRLIKHGATSILPYSMLFDEAERLQFAIIPIKEIRLRSDLIWLRSVAWRAPVRRFSKILEDLIAEMIEKDGTGFLSA